ncbi:MAG TPA: hypothetical protein PKY82_26800 [Pyrinomonadaceae bacterium]|nr:hypothetical protein [Pyrinomonadaceae bacterium]
METETGCVDGTCGYGICGDEVGCSNQGDLCSLANLLEAEESEFHDSQLIEATQAIKEILAKIPPDKRGRQLSFINAKPGLLLAWVDHSGAAFRNAKTKEIITHDSHKDKIAAALKLKR